MNTSVEEKSVENVNLENIERQNNEIELNHEHYAENLVQKIKNICESINPEETDTSLLRKTIDKIYAISSKIKGE